MMDGPWLGIVVMTVLIVGLIWWCWWAMRQGKKEQD